MIIPIFVKLHQATGHPQPGEPPVSAVVSMRVHDYFANGTRWWVWLHEKGQKQRTGLLVPIRGQSWNDRADMAGGSSVMPLWLSGDAPPVMTSNP